LKEQEGEPWFEAVLAPAGLLAVAYLLRMWKWDREHPRF
jgi:hypothetical protein